MPSYLWVSTIGTVRFISEKAYHRIILKDALESGWASTFQVAQTKQTKYNCPSCSFHNLLFPGPILHSPYQECVLFCSPQPQQVLSLSLRKSEAAVPLPPQMQVSSWFPLLCFFLSRLLVLSICCGRSRWSAPAYRTTPCIMPDTTPASRAAAFSKQQM